MSHPGKENPADEHATYTPKSSRVVAARKLQRRTERAAARRFLVEGPQAVREALAATVTVHELFVTPEAAARHGDLVAAAESAGARLSVITPGAAEALSETITPQGVIAVCDLISLPVRDALAGRPWLVAVLIGVSDPGNAGTVIRVADAAGAGAVVLTGDAVDPHNGKCVRASTGSVFHLPIGVDRDVAAVLKACRDASLQLLAATGGGRLGLDEALERAALANPTAWLFGSEAHGLDQSVLDAADDTVRVPILGRAESLNLATAAAVCLYASAWAGRSPGPR